MCALSSMEKVILPSNNPSKSRTSIVTQLQALISGLQKQFPSGQFTLGNTAYTTATLVQALQELVDAINAANTVEASAKVAVSTLKTTMAKVGPIVVALRRNLLSMYGNAATTLALFGLVPRKAPAPRTGLEMAAAAAKAKATREVRGTASKKSKLAVKGNVTGVTVTPVTEPAEPASPSPAPSPSAQPAPAAAPVPSGTVAK
jgi:hypothetical protein